MHRCGVMRRQASLRSLPIGQNTPVRDRSSQSGSRRRRSGGHRQLVVYIGVPAFVIGVIAVAPDWWWKLARTTTMAAGRNWFPTLCFVTATAAALAAVGRWWWPWRRERPSTWAPITSRLPLLLHVVILVSISIVMFVGLAWVAWRLSGQPDLFLRRSRSESVPGQATPTSSAWTVANTLDAIKILLSVVAGIGAIVALTIAYRKQDLGEAAEYREDTRLFIERFGRAADQVGADQAAVRIAGIYSLARLADEWRDGRQTCIDVLCAYLRMSRSQRHEESGPAFEKERTPKWWRRGRAGRAAVSPRDTAEASSDEHVRQTILGLIRGHLLPGARHPWQGHTFDLTGAVLRDADFSEVVLEPRTDLNLAGTTLFGLINFRGIQLIGGSVDFIGAKSREAFINFPDATLEGGKLDFYGMEFGYGTNLSFTNVRFSGATVQFNSNSFSGGRVGFIGAEFEAGIVEFSMPVNWNLPPLLPDPLPKIVHLPSQHT